MRYLWVISAVCLICSGSVSIAQDSNETDLLIQVSDVDKQRIADRNALKYGKSEYWAKTNRISVNKFRIDLLEEVGAEISLRAFGLPPITLVSNGVHRDTDSAFIVGTWNGVIQHPNKKTTYPVELNITTRVVMANGESRFPKPSYTFRNSDSGSTTTVTISDEEDIAGQTEVYTVAGTIYVPYLKRQYRIVPLANDPGYSILYEVDEDKSIQKFDNFGFEPTSPDAIEAQRRSGNYKQYVEQLERRLAEDDNSEQEEEL